MEGFHGNRGLVPQARELLGLMSPTRRFLNRFPRPSRGTHTANGQCETRVTEGEDDGQCARPRRGNRHLET